MINPIIILNHSRKLIVRTVPKYKYFIRKPPTLILPPLSEIQKTSPIKKKTQQKVYPIMGSDSRMEYCLNLKVR